MVFVSERAAVNQRIQVGAESTSALGTSVAASKLLENYSFVFGIEATVDFYTPTGRKYPAVQEENQEWTAGTMSGTLDYNSVIYPLASAMGSVAPVAHGSSSTAKDWIFVPPLTGSIVPQTYTFQQGDSTHAHQLSYGLFTQFGYKGDRTKFETSGKLIGQLLSDGITMTTSPTVVNLAPVVAKQVNIFLDTTYSALGTTQLTRALSIDYTMDGIYDAFWAINRSTPSWTTHVDMAPKTTCKLKLEANTQGMSLLNTLQVGSTVYLQVDAQGLTIDSANSVVNEFKHQFAVKVGKPSTFSDDKGIFAIEWELTIVEDSTWGNSQIFTVTNLLTSL